MDLASINGIAVVAAAVSAFVLGGVWYGPVFGKQWQAFMGLSDEDISGKGHPAVIFGSAFALTLVQAVFLATLIPPGTGVVSAIAQALLIGVAFVATAFGVNYLFSRHPLNLWCIDAGYNVAQFAIMGAIIGALA